MRSDLIAMTPKEVRRLEAMHDLAREAVTQGQVAVRLGLSVRQVKRLAQRFRLGGEGALVSRARGRPGNRQRDRALIGRAIDLVRAQYADFGPTFASEKLRERHGLELDRETLRKAMIAAKLWRPKPRRAPYHPPRERRPRFGELVQIDGSPHAWFEERGPRCTLLVFIDDATSGLVGLHFAKAETTAAYFALAQRYFQQYGLPNAFYSDRYSVFRVNGEAAGDAQTQFARAMDELDVALICANSPQAKGRVERVNRTLQDRLTKELRIAQIATIDAANAFVPQYIEQHNRRFAVAPSNDEDAHRALAQPQRLARILVTKTPRKLSKDMTFQHRQGLYYVLPTLRRYAFPHALVDLIEPPDEPFRLERNGIDLAYRLLKRLEKQPPVVAAKELAAQPLWKDMPQMSRGPVAKNHPWRKSIIHPALRQPLGDISNLQDGDTVDVR